MNEWEVLSKIARTILTMSAAGSVTALLIPFSTFVSIPFSTPLAPVQELIEGNVKSTAEWQEETAQAKYNMPYLELEAQKQVEVAYKEFGLLKGRLNNHILFTLITLGGIVFLIEIVGYVIFMVRLRRRRLPANDSEAALLRQLCGSRRLPRLYRNPMAPTPMLAGILHPAIYLPDMEYSEVQVRNILLHELTYLGRHDVLIKWAAALTVHLHWFNPIVYYICREIDRACELACDESVINHLDTDGKQDYGDTLIAAAAEKKLPKTVISTTMCEEKKILKERLDAIMKGKKTSKKRMVFSCFLLLAFFCIALVSGASVPGETTADILFREYGNETSLTGDEIVTPRETKPNESFPPALPRRLP